MRITAIIERPDRRFPGFNRCCREVEQYAPFGWREMSEAPALAQEYAKLIEVLQLLKDAKDRLAVHALSDVGNNLDRAIQLLEE